MQREILFRGKSIETGEWIYGSLIGNDVIVGKIVEFEEDYFCTESWNKVYPETVGQFTGVDDVNGKMIFEGDVYNMGDKNIRYIVEFRRAQFIGKQVKSSSYVGINYWSGEIVLVGNIHDNPELL